MDGNSARTKCVQLLHFRVERDITTWLQSKSLEGQLLPSSKKTEKRIHRERTVEDLVLNARNSTVHQIGTIITANYLLRTLMHIVTFDMRHYNELFFGGRFPFVHCVTHD